MLEEGEEDDVRVVDAPLASTISAIGCVAQRTGQLRECASLLNPTVDPDAVVATALLMLSDEYAQASSVMWFWNWCTTLWDHTTAMGVPEKTNALVCLFVKHVLLPRVAADMERGTISIDSLAPVVFVATTYGYDCSALSRATVCALVPHIQFPLTFALLNGYVVSSPTIMWVRSYLFHVERGMCDAMCANVMIQNGMVHSINRGRILTRLLTACASAPQREGACNLVAHLVTQSSYLALVARDYVLNAPSMTSSAAHSHCVGRIMDAVTTMLPYLPHDVRTFDTSASTWEPVMHRIPCPHDVPGGTPLSHQDVSSSAFPRLPWNVPNRALSE